MGIHRRKDPTPDGGEGMRIDIGVDLHKTQFTVYVLGREKSGVNGQYFTTEEGYMSFMQKLREWKRDGEAIRIGVESTGNTRYFKHRMEEEGHSVVVINTMKFKVINESVKKTDTHDAATIAEFLSKDMLPESRLCSEASEQLRRLLKVRSALVRTRVTVKNQIHGLLVSMGMEDTRASLQSKRGRQKILDTLAGAGNGLVVQPLFETIDRLTENEAMKPVKGHGKSIIATSRKMSKIVWYMLTREKAFNIARMTDKTLERKIETMRGSLSA